MKLVPEELHTLDTTILVPEELYALDTMILIPEELIIYLRRNYWNTCMSLLG